MFANRRSRLREERGFTLIEVAVAMPIMLIVMGGLTLMLTTITHWSSQSREGTILQTESRSAMNTLAGNIRGAFYGDGVTPEISSATATSITFTTPDEYATTVVANSGGRLPPPDGLVPGDRRDASAPVQDELEHVPDGAVDTGVELPGLDERVADRPRAAGLDHEHGRFHVLHRHRHADDAAHASRVPDRQHGRDQGHRRQPHALHPGEASPTQFTVTDIVALRQTDN